MNNQLKQIRKDFSLSNKQIAVMCGVSEVTARAWFCDPESTAYRVMPERYLRLLNWELTNYCETRIED